MRIFFGVGFFTSLPGVILSNFGQPILSWMCVCIAGFAVSGWAPCWMFGHEPVHQPTAPVLTLSLYGEAHHIQLCSRCHVVYWSSPRMEKSITHERAHSKHEG